MINMGQTRAKAEDQGRLDNQRPRLEDPKRLETFVVLAVNDVGTRGMFCGYLARQAV